MKLKTFLTKSLMVLGLAACISLAGVFLYSVFKTLVVSPVSLTAQDVLLVDLQKISSVLPARLKIPSIGIDTFVEQVAVTPGGAMDVPKGANNVGWFDLSPRPGAKGSAVIDGHSGYK